MITVTATQAPPRPLDPEPLDPVWVPARSTRTNRSPSIRTTSRPALLAYHRLRRPHPTGRGCASPPSRRCPVRRPSGGA